MMNDLANKELRKLYHQVLKGLYRAKTIRENTDNDDIYSEFLLYDEDVNLILSDGIYKDEEENLDDAVEFFDGFINLEEVLTSEIEAFKSDYFYCEKCKNL